LADDPKGSARGLHGSFTLGAGQFCTKPGLVFLSADDGAAAFREELRALTAGSGTFTMLTAEIGEAYHCGLAERHGLKVESTVGAEAVSPATHAMLFETDLKTFDENPLLAEEIFGPSTVVVDASDRDALLAVAAGLEGHLTATILGTETDLLDNQELIEILERKVGRLLFNGFPTGVEVSHAMVHGGPYPATSDSRFTSVGSQAIFRFVRPRCYQNFPEALLPEALRNGNPLGISRLVDGKLTLGRIEE
jgi:alpha-ketoglutaric semialdehyde dehydrogenase